MFGNFDILEAVGQGGMGVVYRAHDVTLDRIVALKVLKEDLRTHATIVERFRREGKAFASLNHPNIVHIYSVGSVGRIPYISMEFIDGLPLSRLMKKEGRVGWERALHIGKQIAEALASAHEAQIIHRDIKPANILIDSEDRAFVTDFGIAKILTAEIQLTIDGSRLGTPQYMSPERCQNHAVTASSDIYSLGVVLFQLMAAHLPYDAKTPVSLIRQIAADPPKRLREYLPGVPEDVERVIAYTLEKNPRHRPPSAERLAEMMDRVLRGEPLDEAVGTGKALEQLREAITTPTPFTETDLDAAPLPRRLAIRVKRRWRGLSANAKSVVFATAAVAVATFAGLSLARYQDRDYAMSAVRASVPERSAWQATGTLATVTDESAEAVLFHIQLDDFRVAQAAWGPDGLVVALQGVERTPRAGQTSIAVLRPDEREAALLVPPALGSGGPRYYIASAFSSDGRRSSALVADLESRTLFFHTEGKGELSPDETFQDTERWENLAVSPKGRAVVLASGGATRRIVGTDASGAGSAYRTLSTVSGPIHWLDYSPDGAWIFYTHEIDKLVVSLKAVATDENTAAERRLMDGPIRLMDDSIFNDGSAVVAANLADSGSRLVLVNNVAEPTRTDLGPGSAIALAPDQESMACIANDYLGKPQVWLARLDAPNERRQLTYLGEGVDALCGVSPDGRWVFASVLENSRPGVVFRRIDAANQK